MGNFVSQPHRDKLGVQAKSPALRIRDAREVFEADERHTAPIDDELAGIRRSHAHHKHDIELAVCLEQHATLVFSGTGKGNHVGMGKHRAEVITIRAHGFAHEFVKMRARRFNHVILPIRLEQCAVRIEVLMVRGFGIRTLQHRKKLWQQIDQHGPEASFIGNWIEIDANLNLCDHVIANKYT